MDGGGQNFEGGRVERKVGSDDEAVVYLGCRSVGRCCGEIVHTFGSALPCSSMQLRCDNLFAMQTRLCVFVAC